MADADSVAKAFVDHYYRTFDENRQNLSSLYSDQSMLTFQGERFQGAQAILQKLTGLAFQRCQHQLSSVDAQPSLSGGITVFVTGHLLPEGETNPLKFSQVFHLVPVGGSFIVSNDMFRLNYA